MRIGIIGSGKIGGTTARLFVAAGHEVAVANSRGPASRGPLIAALGPGAHAVTVPGTRVVKTFKTMYVETLATQGRLQQPGSPVSNRPMTARDAQRVLAGLR